jgi:hypothetical protein
VEAGEADAAFDDPAALSSASRNSPHLLYLLARSAAAAELVDG